jgi:hypothetical protein
MPRHKIPGFRTTSVKEARELAKLPFAADAGLANVVGGEVRLLQDGRVFLYTEGDRGVIYPSREALEKVVCEAEAEAAKGPFDPAKELLPPLDDFLRDVEKHAQSLGKVLRLPDEVLDRSVESLGAVHKAVVRIKRDKRFTPEVFTPLTAYVGEVMRLLCDGRWGKLPATIKKSMPTFDMAAWHAFALAEQAARRAEGEVAEKAYADAKAKRMSEYRACMVREAARDEARKAGPRVEAPKPTGSREYDEPVKGHEQEPVVWPRGSGDCTDVMRAVHPLVPVVMAFMGERSDGTLQMQVEVLLMPWINAKRKAASTG